MPHSLHFIFSCLLWYFGFMYLIAPILVRFSQRLSAHPRFEPMDWARVPPEAQQYLAENGQALMALGFQPAAYLFGSGLTANVLPLLVVSINRQSGDKATTSVFYAGTGGAMTLKARYVEFTAWYADGSSLDTNDNASLGSFVPDPKHPVYRFPTLTDIPQLFALHRQLTQGLEDTLRGDWPPAVAPPGFTHREIVPGTMKVLPRPGEEAEDLVEVMVEGYERQCRAGRLYYDAAADAYRPTLRGAYLMCWGQLWPVTALLRAAKRRREGRLLRALGRHIPAPGAA